MNLDYYCILTTELVSPGNYKHICSRCQGVSFNQGSRLARECPKRTVASPNKRAARPPCVHLGGAVRLVPCTLCRHVKTEIKVYACGIHHECQFGNKLAGVKTCGPGCGDYT